ncbi:hypothetical protein BKA63DRAFT_249424 [Paraphoma chrysanthemicola]|nr:hypothetical protein BKA63DRAFT_249424 [Paraphoma chrysanthemicola]
MRTFNFRTTAAKVLLTTTLHSLPALGQEHQSPANAVVSSISESDGRANQYIATVIQPTTLNYTTTALWTTTQQCPLPSTTRTIHSIVFPSPDAAPIEITSQSQVLTSFVPEMTWCVGPAVAFRPVTGAPYLNATTSFTPVASGTGSCETVYAPIITTVCATTLTGLASKVTITKCEQEVTFSTECSFTLVNPTPITSSASLITPSPSVKRIFTYWLAPWQSLTAGNTPSDVDIKICIELDDGKYECVRHREVWEVVVVTRTIITTRPIGFTATLSGPGTLIVETLQTSIIDTIETIDLSTTLLLETEIETESTITGRASPTGLGAESDDTVSTVFLTKTVRRKSTSSSDVEPTTTVRRTSTITRRGTTTITRPRPSSSL